MGGSMSAGPSVALRPFARVGSTIVASSVPLTLVFSSASRLAAFVFIVETLLAKTTRACRPSRLVTVNQRNRRIADGWSRSPTRSNSSGYNNIYLLTHSGLGAGMRGPREVDERSLGGTRESTREWFIRGSSPADGRAFTGESLEFSIANCSNIRVINYISSEPAQLDERVVVILLLHLVGLVAFSQGALEPLVMVSLRRIGRARQVQLTDTGNKG